MQSKVLFAKNGIEYAFDVSDLVDRPTVVWIHGEFGSFDDPPLNDVLKSSVNLINLHLPGWGKSVGGESFDQINELATAMWWLLEEITVNKVLLAGYGLGATVAIEMAIQQPVRISGMVFGSPFGMFSESDPGVDIFALMQRDLLKEIYADPKSELVKRHFPSSEDGYERGLIAIRRVEVLGAASRYIFPIPDTNIRSRSYRLAKIPMTILFGRSDGVVPFSLSELWQESFPHAEISILEGAGHMLAYETDEISNAITKMLADQGAHK